MAIKDLLDKIKNYKDWEECKSIENKDPYFNGTLLFDPYTIQFMDGITLNEKYDVLNSVTQTHFCQTGTDNKLDIHDRPYNHELWIKHDELLTLIAIEMQKRTNDKSLRESIQ